MSSKKIVYKHRFEMAYLRLAKHDQALVDKALEKFGNYLLSGRASVGLGLKRLESDTYEFRAGLFLRVVYIDAEKEVFISLLGSHDEVRKFLKNQ